MANGAWQVQSSRATKFRTTKINSGGRVLLFTPENFLLYGILSVCGSIVRYMYHRLIIKNLHGDSVL